MPGAGQADPVWQRLDTLVDWERAQRARMRVDVAPAADLMRRLGDPQHAFKVVHVTGTKGKGSVCALIEAGLLHAGLQAGRYASPHLEHMTERISLMGRPIEERQLAVVLRRALDARDAAVAEGSAGRDASWFDVMTAAAFCAFADAGLEWAVVEVGLGGRLDSTNVVMPELAVVTNIGLEHTDILGETVEAIAAEKAGIAKPGRPLLTAVPADAPAGRVLRERARDLGIECLWVDARPHRGVASVNLAVARAGLDELGRQGVRSITRGMPLGAEDLPPDAVAAARLPGRVEALQVALPDAPQGLRVVLDGAHVPFALAAVLAELREQPEHAAAPWVLLALGADKDAAGMVACLRGVARKVVCCSLGHGRRCWPADELARICASHGLDALGIDSPDDALAFCLTGTPSQAWLLVTGSLYLVGDLRTRLSVMGRQRGGPGNGQQGEQG